MTSPNKQAVSGIAGIPSAGHVPGPWEFRLEAVRTVIFRRGEIGEQALAVGAGSYPAHIANARLITAAPDLLKACADWIEWLKPDSPWREDAADYEAQMLDAMRAAIAKALGQ